MADMRKNIYTVRLINTEVVSSFTKEKVGKDRLIISYIDDSKSELADE